MNEKKSFSWENILIKYLVKYALYTFLILAAILMIYLFGWEDEGHIKMFIKKVIRAIIK
jgi:hypothetical protein